jgi:hypothetical protein
MLPGTELDARPYIDNGVGKVARTQRVGTLFESVHGDSLAMIQIEDHVSRSRILHTEGVCSHKMVGVVEREALNTQLGVSTSSMPGLNDASALLRHRSKDIWMSRFAIMPC